MKKVKKNRAKMVLKIFNFLSTLFRNKDFISQEGPIFADFENITYYWIKIVNFPQTDKIYTWLEISWKKITKNLRDPGVKRRFKMSFFYIARFRFLLRRKLDNKNLLELLKVEFLVINGSLKTCNTIFKLALVSSEKLKYKFFPMRSIIA